MEIEGESFDYLTEIPPSFRYFMISLLVFKSADEFNERHSDSFLVFISQNGVIWWLKLDFIPLEQSFPFEVVKPCMFLEILERTTMSLSRIMA